MTESIHLGAIRYKQAACEDWQYGVGVFSSPGVADISCVYDITGVVVKTIHDYEMLAYHPVSVQSGCATFSFGDNI